MLEGNHKSFKIIKSLSELSGEYDAIFCDAWGVVHNGLRANTDAVASLIEVRKANKPVIILTNAPRTQVQLIRHFDELGVPSSCYDKIISSGEVARALIAAGNSKCCYHIGPPVDVAIFEGTGVVLVDRPEEADFILVSGLRDNTCEREDDYVPLLSALLTLQLPMICVNPDRHVHIGNERRACAGALAEIYENIGGEVIWVGKPHEAIYNHCEQSLLQIFGKEISRERILVVGDAIHTDILGANAMGYPSLFVASGIHAEDLKESHISLDDPELAEFCKVQGAIPDFVMSKLY